MNINACLSYHPNAGEIKETSFILSDGNEICHTAGDFVTDDVKEGIYDMELAIILALGFTNVTSYKVISDNMNYKEYEHTIEN